METLLWPAVNFLILVGLLIYYVRMPVSNFISARHHTWRDELHAAADRLKQAQTRLQELFTRLQTMDSEITSIRQQAQQEAGAVKGRIVSEAQQLSTMILNDARVAANSLHDDLRKSLSGEFAVRVIDRAEALLKQRLTEADQLRIRKEFSQKLETLS